MLTEIRTNIYKIDDEPFAITPRAFTENNDIKVNFQYHSGLLKLNEGDNVEIKIYLDEKPEEKSYSYLMNGMIYEKEIDHFKSSFGGLLMEYQGNTEGVEKGQKIHVAIQKI